MAVATVVSLLVCIPMKILIRRTWPLQAGRRGRGSTDITVTTTRRLRREDGGVKADSLLGNPVPQDLTINLLTVNQQYFGIHSREIKRYLRSWHFVYMRIIDTWMYHQEHTGRKREREGDIYRGNIGNDGPSIWPEVISQKKFLSSESDNV